MESVRDGFKVPDLLFNELSYGCMVPDLFFNELSYGSKAHDLLLTRYPMVVKYLIGSLTSCPIGYGT